MGWGKFCSVQENKCKSLAHFNGNKNEINCFTTCNPFHMIYIFIVVWNTVTASLDCNRSTFRFLDQAVLYCTCSKTATCLPGTSCRPVYSGAVPCQGFYTNSWRCIFKASPGKNYCWISVSNGSQGSTDHYGETIQLSWYTGLILLPCVPVTLVPC